MLFSKWSIIKWISLKFYDFFWDIIKVDLMNMPVDFFHGILPIHRLNFGIITLST